MSNPKELHEVLKMVKSLARLLHYRVKDLFEISADVKTGSVEACGSDMEYHKFNESEVVSQAKAIGEWLDQNGYQVERLYCMVNNETEESIFVNDNKLFVFELRL